MKGGGLVMFLKAVKGMLNKLISLSTQYDSVSSSAAADGDDEAAVPEDVKEGHFVVCTVDEGGLRRSVVELSYLTHPGFLKLLELAENEFGFEQMGILVIPCNYHQLQSVIATI